MWSAHRRAAWQTRTGSTHWRPHWKPRSWLMWIWSVVCVIQGNSPEREWLILMHLVLWMCFILCGDVGLTKNLKWKFQNQSIMVPFLDPSTPYSLCLQTSPPPPSPNLLPAAVQSMQLKGNNPVVSPYGAEVTWMFSLLLFQPFFCCNPSTNDITVSPLYVKCTSLHMYSTPKILPSRNC